jgi:DNA-binding transcriptional MerR regulator
MKIDEIANRAGVTVDTVRFYERVGVPSAGTDGVRLSEVRPR